MILGRMMSSVLSISGELQVKGEEVIFHVYEIIAGEVRIKLSANEFRAMIEGLKETLMKGESKWETSFKDISMSWKMNAETGNVSFVFIGESASGTVEFSPWAARGLLKQLEVFATFVEERVYAYCENIAKMKIKNKK
jgi:hypothetical protein